jgi:hypothetical protein
VRAGFLRIEEVVRPLEGWEGRAWGSRLAKNEAQVEAGRALLQGEAGCLQRGGCGGEGLAGLVQAPLLPQGDPERI